MSGGGSKGGGSRGGGRGSENGEGEVQELTPYANAPIQKTFQPSLPGGLDAIAAQLGQGYGVPQADMSGFLSNLYGPMNMLQFQEPISTTAEQFDEDKHEPISTGNTFLDDLLMGGGKMKTGAERRRAEAEKRRKDAAKEREKRLKEAEDRRSEGWSY